MQILGGEDARFIGGPMSSPEVWRVLATMLGHWELRGFGQFSVVERTSGACIGRVGAWMPEGWPGQEIGWALNPAYEGKGYASEAAKAAMQWAFETLGWQQVIHCIHPDNLRSKALAKRVGSAFLHMVTLPPPLHRQETEVYGQTRQAWQQRTLLS